MEVIDSILIFKTNIEDSDMIKTVTPVLDNHPYILNWSVDTEDIDKVLRIVAEHSLSEQEVMKAISSCGFICTVLPD